MTCSRKSNNTCQSYDDIISSYEELKEDLMEKLKKNGCFFTRETMNPPQKIIILPFFHNTLLYV